MAASELTVQRSAVTGTALTYAAANADGNFFENNGRILLLVTNGGASPITVTVDAKNPCNQGFSHDGGGSVAAGATKMFGPFATARFNNSADGTVDVTYSDVTTVTAAAAEMA